MDDVWTALQRSLATDAGDFPFTLTYAAETDDAPWTLASATNVAPGDPVAPATLEGGGEIWPVASLLDEALIERVVFDGPSRVIDLGRARRFSGAVRRALDVVDRGCTHPGCDLAAERCQGDHVQPWSRGGRTDPDNGQLRCAYHNRWRWQHADSNPPAPPPQRPPPDAAGCAAEGPDP